MTEDLSYIPEPPETFDAVPEKKKNKTLWIILAIVVVILICCCLVVLVAGLMGYFSFDQLDFYSYLLPYLSWI